MNHRQFHYIKRVDRNLITINTIWLLFVALLPFSTSLIGDYGQYYTSNVIFNLNMLLIGLLYSLNWYYATEKGLVDENLDEKTIKFLRRSNLILPLLSILAIILSFFIYTWAEWAYVLTPIIIRIQRH